MVRGGRRRKQQGIRPKDSEDRAPLGAVALPKRDIGPLSAEHKRKVLAEGAIGFYKLT